MLNIKNYFALNQQVVIERQCILGEVDCSLNRVLDRHNAIINFATFDGI